MIEALAGNGVALKNVQNATELLIFKNTTKHADDVVRLISEKGNDFVSLYEKYGSEAVEQCLNHGDEVIELVGKYGDDCADLVMRYGDDVLEGISKHGDEFLERYAKEGDEFIEEYLEKGDGVFESGSGSWIRNLESTSNLNIDDFQSLKDNGVVKLNASGSDRPLTGTPNSYYKTGNGEHIGLKSI